MKAFAVILLFAAGVCAVPCVLDSQEPSVADRYPGNCTQYDGRLNCCPNTEANAPGNFEAALNKCGTLSDLCFNEMKGVLCDALCSPMQGEFTPRAFRPRICHDFANFLFIACLAVSLFSVFYFGTIPLTPLFSQKQNALLGQLSGGRQLCACVCVHGRRGVRGDGAGL